MSEPRLEDIEDYDTLKGQKRKIVWAVVLTGLVMGVIYTFAYYKYDNKEENIEVQEKFQKVPMR